MNTTSYIGQCREKCQEYAAFLYSWKGIGFTDTPKSQLVTTICELIVHEVNKSNIGCVLNCLVLTSLPCWTVETHFENKIGYTVEFDQQYRRSGIVISNREQPTRKTRVLIINTNSLHNHSLRDFHPSLIIIDTATLDKTFAHEQLAPMICFNIGVAIKWLRMVKDEDTSTKEPLEGLTVAMDKIAIEKSDRSQTGTL
jgi:hypothetical protein